MNESEHFKKSQLVIETSFSLTLYLPKSFQSFSSLESPISPVIRAGLTHPFATHGCHAAQLQRHHSHCSLCCFGQCHLGLPTKENLLRAISFLFASLLPFKLICRNPHVTLSSLSRMTPWPLTLHSYQFPIIRVYSGETYLSDVPLPGIQLSLKDDWMNDNRLVSYNKLAHCDIVIYNKKYIFDIYLHF